MKTMITPENILYHELIGLDMTIEKSSNKSLFHLSGRIIFETKNMLIIRTKNNILRKIPKLAANQIKIHLDSVVCVISGRALIGRPEDRVLRSQKSV
jgi:ribonuclease P protein subunit POP4